MKQVAHCEFGGGLSEISSNRLIIKLIKRNIRIPSGSLKEESYGKWLSFLCFLGLVYLGKSSCKPEISCIFVHPI